MKVAVAGVGHYHATYPPFYLELLKKHGVEIVGLADPDLAVAEAIAARFGGTPYVDFRTMVEEREPDLLLGLGRHIDMPPVVEYAVEQGVPLLMEKPWGTDPATVSRIAQTAEESGAWVMAPFSMRYSLWAQRCRDLVQAGNLGRVSHVRFRMVRPGVQRYIDQGCEWMLRKAEAGGGVLLNLGVHGMDLCRYITGEEPVVVSAVTSNAVFGLDVEDYAHVILQTPLGVLFHVEAGYTFPLDGGQDDERVLYAERAMLREVATGLEVVTSDGSTVERTPRDFVGSWEGVIVDCIERLEHGAPPPNQPSDFARAVSLVFDAYRLAGTL
jgi:predicted dehydrogenase